MVDARSALPFWLKGAPAPSCPNFVAMVVGCCWWFLAAALGPSGEAYDFGEGMKEKVDLEGFQRTGDVEKANLTFEGTYKKEMILDWKGYTAGSDRGRPRAVDGRTEERIPGKDSWRDQVAVSTQEGLGWERKSVKIQQAFYRGTKFDLGMKALTAAVDKEEEAKTEEEVKEILANDMPKTRKRGWRSGKSRKWKGFIRRRRRKCTRTRRTLTLVVVQIVGLVLIAVRNQRHEAGRKGSQGEWQEVLELIWYSGAGKTKRCGGPEGSSRGTPVREGARSDRERPDSSGEKDGRSLERKEKGEDEDMKGDQARKITLKEYLMERKFVFVHFLAEEGDDRLMEEMRREGGKKGLCLMNVAIPARTGEVAVWDGWLRLAKEGHVDGVYCAPPSQTYQEKFAEDGVGHEWRTKEHPKGVPSLTAEEKDQCEQEDKMWRMAIKYAEAVKGSSGTEEFKGAAVICHPSEEEWDWSPQGFEEGWKEEGTQHTMFHWCAYQIEEEKGKRFWKRMKIKGVLHGLNSFGRECNCGTKGHKAANTLQRCRTAQQLPREAASELAKRFTEHMLWLAEAEVRKDKMKKKGHHYYGWEAGKELGSKKEKHRKMDLRERGQGSERQEGRSPPIGGLRNAQEAVARCEGLRTVGRRLRGAWTGFVGRENGALLIATTYGSWTHQLSSTTVNKWMKELKRVVGAVGRNLVQEPSKWRKESPWAYEVIQAWATKAEDPDRGIAEWAHSGAPLGLRCPIPETNVFKQGDPIVAELVAWEEWDRADGGVLSFHRSAEDMPHETLEALEPLEKDAMVLRVEKEELAGRGWPTSHPARLEIREEKVRQDSSRWRVRMARRKRGSFTETVDWATIGDVVAALKKITQAAKDKKENDTSVELLRIEVVRPLEHLGPMEGEAPQSVFIGPGQQFYAARTLMPGMKAAALLWGRWMALIARLLQGMFEEEELAVVVLPKEVILVLQGDQVRRDQMAALALTSLTALGLNIQWGRGKRGRDILVDGASLTKTQLGGEVVQLAWPYTEVRTVPRAAGSPGPGTGSGGSHGPAPVRDRTRAAPQVPK